MNDLRHDQGRAPSGFQLRGEVGGVESSIHLRRGVNRIGSDSSCDIYLPCPGVSRRHATVRVAAAHVVVIDSGSKNGTFVNAHPVERAELSLDDRLGIGPVELRLAVAHPGDAELGLELQAGTPAEAEGRASEDATTASVRPSGDLLVRWLGLVQECADVLAETGREPTHEVMAVLVRELPVRAAALLELGAQGEATLRSFCGEAEPGELEALERRALLEGQRGHEAESLVFDGNITIYLAGVESAVGLMTLGDFPGRVRCAPLLAAVTALLRAQIPGKKAAPNRRRAEGEIRFPQGYVVGVSNAVRNLHAQIASLAGGDLPVLIVGETGVGKDLFAQMLHLSSPRSGPFTAINCAAIPEELLEAELFGIGDRVATGVAGRKGRFQLAEGGTLFLDEVAEMAPGLQVKLLRVLQERKLHPLGGSPVSIDVRLISATNADIEAEVEQGRFRRDFFYRLAGVVVAVPSLRERREDIPLLLERFLERFCDGIGKRIRGVTVRALRVLRDYRWPGNVRELEHLVRRLVYLCPEGQAIDFEMLPEEVRAWREGEASKVLETPGRTFDSAPEPGFKQPPSSLNLFEIERRAVEEALRRCAGNQVRAANELGISRSALRRRIKRYRSETGS